jgi:4-diphosphocytidyl-2C-methyl-D-erythritol kinase
VVSSGVHVATAQAYEALGRGLTFPDSSRVTENFEAVVWALEQSRSAASVSAANDFESSVFRQHPPLERIRAKLEAVSAGARMTGSGSAIFALFRSAEQRKQAEHVLAHDRMFANCRVMRSVLVNRTGYRRMWQRQLSFKD